MSARILAVDDTPPNLRLLEALLAKDGYEVVTASSGEEALRAIAEKPPDLVLMDILMPGMDGYELTRQIRANPKTRFLPIVLMTASVDQDKTRALESGADDFVPKPISQHELAVRVRSLLRIKQYHDTIERQKEQLARFLSPQVADLISSAEGEVLLAGHRREITVVFCDLRGFTAFSETAEPEEALGLLRARRLHPAGRGPQPRAGGLQSGPPGDLRAQRDDLSDPEGRGVGVRSRTLIRRR